MIWTIFSAYAMVINLFWKWYINHWVDIAVIGSILSICKEVAWIFSNRNVEVTKGQKERDSGLFILVGIIISWVLPMLATILFWLTIAIIPATLTICAVKIYEIVTHKNKLPNSPEGQ